MYRYLDHLTWADVAFEAEAETVEDLFRSAGNATLNAMTSDLSSVLERETRELTLRSDECKSELFCISSLLHEFLEKIVFYKDANQLLLKPYVIQILYGPSKCEIFAELRGETIDPIRHQLVSDVKAVTHHQFKVEHLGERWRAQVVLDV